MARQRSTLAGSWVISDPMDPAYVPPSGSMNPRATVVRPLAQHHDPVIEAEVRQAINHTADLGSTTRHALADTAIALAKQIDRILDELHTDATQD